MSVYFGAGEKARLHGMADADGGAAISSSELTEADLIELMALAEGDRAEGAAREAFGEFFRLHQGWLVSMLRTRRIGRLVDWDEGVKDVVQITFHRAFLGAHKFELDRLASCEEDTAARRVRAWLGGIANHVIADLLRAQVSVVELDDERDVDPSSSPDDLEAAPETPLVQALAKELEALPDREREIMLADMEHKIGATHEHLPAGVARALADKWNTTPANIRQIRRRTRERLKEKLAHLFN